MQLSYQLADIVQILESSKLPKSTRKAGLGLWLGFVVGTTVMGKLARGRRRLCEEHPIKGIAAKTTDVYRGFASGPCEPGAKFRLIPKRERKEAGSLAFVQRVWKATLEVLMKLSSRGMEARRRTALWRADREMSQIKP